ncbi:prephenate dehydrogenase [Streptomyces sp. NPDC087300]|uniref:prephenate dehydrogenase n=1 Tax=Streptomyces sp. NPDC087300 TaxID=3365780 RepID=UPI00380A1972
MTPLHTVTIIGTGMIGTSIALALAERRVTVHLQDASEEALRIAEAMGAGTVEAAGRPTDLAVLAVPPRHVPGVLRDAQRRGTALHYTDVASVKTLGRTGPGGPGFDTSRFVGGHPIAGREKPGPAAARGDLFHAKPWVLTPTAHTSDATSGAARRLVELCGATLVTMDAHAHDRAVAVTSHLPHLLSSLTARLLREADPHALTLVGSGLRDFTRISAGDPELWTDILGSNATAVRDALEVLARDVDTTLRALRSLTGEGAGRADAATDEDTEARQWLRTVLEEGRDGRARIPVKYGPQDRVFAQLRVALPDREGELARLLSDVSRRGVNVEDLRIDNDPEAPSGLIELLVDETEADKLALWLTDLGWQVHAPTPA